jgi:ribonucleoside-diphosphate reductase alpha chain
MIELVENKSHMIVKRDGALEPYDYMKMYNVLLWACEDNTTLADSITSELTIKIYDRMPISVLVDEVIDTVSNMTSQITPRYDDVAKRLYLQKMYKDMYNMRRIQYPSYSEVVGTLIDADKIIDITAILTNEELLQLGEAIVPERDFNSTYLGLNLFFDKYSFKVDGKPVELLQHGFMRLAIQGFLYEDESVRVPYIIQRYNDLSTFVYTEATPKWLNSLTEDAQMASCCLHQMDDNSESINKVVSDVGQYSRHGGGNAVDVSSLRMRGSSIGRAGKSSGPTPTIQHIEGAITLYNQLGARPGACVVTFQWWHADVFELLELKDEGGNESKRARKLQYSIKLNRIFLRRLQEGKSITLFDPKVASKLLQLYGTDFDEEYERLERENKGSSTVTAQDLGYLIAKIRAETGNLYIFFDENSNEQSPFKAKITQSNLCQEIHLPTEAAQQLQETLTLDLSNQSYETNVRSKAGLLALCNLSSNNVAKWMTMTEEERYTSAYCLLRASDNLIDWQYYPVKDGEMFNRNYRAIGIGQNNLAYHFALNGIKFSSDEALDEMRMISESMYDTYTRASEQLASERGNFPFFHKTTLTRPSRFSTLFAIAPTATSSIIIGATEGIEPVVNLISEKTGTYSNKQLVPGLAALRGKYELAFDIPTKALYDLAAVRQRYLLSNHQGQSVNTYMANTTSAYDILSDIIYAEKVGLKSLYYLQSRNSTVEACDSCAS